MNFPPTSSVNQDTYICQAINNKDNILMLLLFFNRVDFNCPHSQTMHMQHSALASTEIRLYKGTLPVGLRFFVLISDFGF